MLCCVITSNPGGHYDVAIENGVKEKKESEEQGWGEMYIRQRRVPKRSFWVKSSCFVSKIDNKKWFRSYNSFSKNKHR